MFVIHKRIVTSLCLVALSSILGLRGSSEEIWYRIHRNKYPSMDNLVAPSSGLGLRGRDEEIWYQILRGDEIENNYDEICALRLAYYGEFPYHFNTEEPEGYRRFVPFLKEYGLYVVAKKAGKIVGALPFYSVMLFPPMLEKFRRKLINHAYDPSRFCFVGKPTALLSLQHDEDIEKGLLLICALVAKSQGFTHACMACLDVKSVYEENEVPEGFVDVVSYIEDDYKPLPGPLPFFCRREPGAESTEVSWLVWVSKL